jgi:hypothetical protein
VLFYGYAVDEDNNGYDNGPLASERKIPDSITSYYPIPLPFQIRYSYRSKRDVVVYHRPGIVLKPKLNPLDGDSSTSHSSGMVGQWYRKDSSAIYTVPQVQVTQEVCYDTEKGFDTSEEKTSLKRRCLLLQVSNPTLGPIRVRLLLKQPTSSPESIYNDESSYWDDSEPDADATKQTAIFRNVLLDPLHHTTTDELHVLQIGSESMALNDMTQKIELHSMEDSLLLDYPSATVNSTSINRESAERNAVPDVVRQWGRSKVDNISDESDNNNPTLRLIAQNASTAWYELSICAPMIYHHDVAVNSKPAPSYGIPLLLEIDVGDGSWESSLIPVQKENDVVQLNLVVVLSS